MVLFTVAGIVAQTAFGWRPGLGVGLIVGLVVANLIPSKRSCRAPESDKPAPAAPAPEEHVAR